MWYLVDMEIRVMFFFIGAILYMIYIIVPQINVCVVSQINVCTDFEINRYRIDEVRKYATIVCFI